MWETIITILVIAAAGVWLVCWLRGAAKGKAGCACGSCGKQCPSRETEGIERTKKPDGADPA